MSDPYTAATEPAASTPSQPSQQDVWRQMQEQMSANAAGFQAEIEASRNPRKESPVSVKFQPSGLADLSPHDLAEVARHLDQTYHLSYGSRERQDAMFFRVDRSECLAREPEAVLLRALVAAVRDGGPVKVTADLDKKQRFYFSEMLAQSARRPGDGSTPVAKALWQLHADWDRAAGVRGDENARIAAATGFPVDEVRRSRSYR